ncbi:MAG: hypothetical protein IAF38_18495 [Bacteroidia bacterium]|nr:hypothetical protein [Bacteroidia bacterium]
MKKNISILFAILFFCHEGCSQQSIYEQLKNINGISITKKDNLHFKEYYEIFIDQPIDHFNPQSKLFKQRICVGITNLNAPTVLETEGYAIGNALTPFTLKGCNLILVEHRYFGKSIPDSLDWNFLTVKQAAYDYHEIKELFVKILKGKWLTTGISKGGQAALAYKMYFPDEVNATLAYVTPIKKSVNDPRIGKFFNTVSKTENGKKVFAFQQFAFRNKKLLLKEFDKYVADKGFTFGAMQNETVFEYLLLEYPFAFFQNAFNTKLIPDTATSSPDKIIEEIAEVVPVRFYTEAFRQKLEPSFYMFYHELGYYEYDLTSVKQWLSKENYPNNIFAPKNSSNDFDPAYLTSLNKFISNHTTKGIIFIYGENDPYTSTKAVFEKNDSLQMYIAKGGSHKSRIKDLSPAQQQKVYKQLSAWLKWKITG